ncbi:MAG: IS110 family transposase [Deltaproteobacteria bacterium]|nr:IS110 family transposase [Deltaproteobacteria bacterium]
MNEIRTKGRNIVNEKTLLVTVDIGKMMNMGYCRCPDKTEVKPFEFQNGYQGFNKFLNIILKTQTTKKLEHIVVGFESTGAYAEPLMHFLRRGAIQLVQVNPLHTKKLKELQGNSPSKTDKKDPRVIADIMELGHALTVMIPEGAAADLRRLTNARERVLQRRTALLNQLQDIVFISFPEFLGIMGDVKTQTAHYLLKHYPTPADILESGLDRLISEMKKVSRGKLGIKRATALYEAAKTSVGIQEGHVGLSLELQEFLRSIEECEHFIERLEEEISRCLREIPYSEVLLSMKGIGKITVAGLIGEAGDFRKFRSISELLKYAGLNLYEISSGKRKGNKHISKRGRSLMRKLLFFAAIRTVRKNGIMHDHYQRYLRRGMKKIKALVAVSRKLLGIMLALVRDHTLYQVNYGETQYLSAA